MPAARNSRCASCGTHYGSDFYHRFGARRLDARQQTSIHRHARRGRPRPKCQAARPRGGGSLAKRSVVESAPCLLGFRRERARPRAAVRRVMCCRRLLAQRTGASLGESDGAVGPHMRLAKQRLDTCTADCRIAWQSSEPFCHTGVWGLPVAKPRQATLVRPPAATAHDRRKTWMGI